MFIIDNQTKKDLNLNKEANQSVSDIYNKAVSYGGKKLFFHIFNNPLNEKDFIDKRSELLLF